jgi:hypothetical protein
MKQQSHDAWATTNDSSCISPVIVVLSDHFLFVLFFPNRWIIFCFNFYTGARAHSLDYWFSCCETVLQFGLWRQSWKAFRLFSTFGVGGTQSAHCFQIQLFNPHSLAQCSFSIVQLILCIFESNLSNWTLLSLSLSSAVLYRVVHYLYSKLSARCQGK